MPAPTIRMELCVDMVISVSSRLFEKRRLSCDSDPIKACSLGFSYNEMTRSKIRFGARSLPRFGRRHRLGHQEKRRASRRCIYQVPFPLLDLPTFYYHPVRVQNSAITFTTISEPLNPWLFESYTSTQTACPRKHPRRCNGANKDSSLCGRVSTTLKSASNTSTDQKTCNSQVQADQVSSSED